MSGDSIFERPKATFTTDDPLSSASGDAAPYQLAGYGDPPRVFQQVRPSDNDGGWNNDEEVKRRAQRQDPGKAGHPYADGPAPIFKPDQNQELQNAPNVVAPTNPRVQQRGPQVARRTDSLRHDDQEGGYMSNIGWHAAEIGVQVGSIYGIQRLKQKGWVTDNALLDVRSEKDKIIQEALGAPRGAYQTAARDYRAMLSPHFAPQRDTTVNLLGRPLTEDWLRLGILDTKDEFMSETRDNHHLSQPEVDRLKTQIEAKIQTLPAAERQAVRTQLHEYRDFHVEAVRLEKYQETIRNGFTRLDQPPPEPLLRRFFDKADPGYKEVAAGGRNFVGNQTTRVRALVEETENLSKALRDELGHKRSRGGIHSGVNMASMGFAMLYDTYLDATKFKDVKPFAGTWIADAAQMAILNVPAAKKFVKLGAVAKYGAAMLAHPLGLMWDAQSQDK